MEGIDAVVRRNPAEFEQQTFAIVCNSPAIITARKRPIPANSVDDVDASPQVPLRHPCHTAHDAAQHFPRAYGIS
jgi:hypothetical protein